MDWRSLPPLAALRAFAAVADTGSVTAAGAALNVSHAAISQQIRVLEARLGARLLVRAGRGSALTPEGARLAARLGPAFAEIGRAVEAFTGAEATRPLQVTMTPAFAAGWLMPRIGGFRQRHPGVELMLYPTVALADPEPGGIDLAIRFGNGHWPGLDCALLMETRFVIVAAESLLADHPVREPRDIQALPWLLELGHDEIAGWLRGKGVPEPRSGAAIHLPGNLVLEGLRRGDGVSATTRLFVEEDVAAGRLRILFEEDEPGRGYWLVTRPGPLRPPLRALTAWLRREAGAGGAAPRAPAPMAAPAPPMAVAGQGAAPRAPAPEPAPVAAPAPAPEPVSAPDPRPDAAR